jgi:hypothetical protein
MCCSFSVIQGARVEISTDASSFTPQCSNVFSNKIKPLHVSASDGHHRKATNTSKEMLNIYYMHVVLYGLHQYLK